MFYMEKMEEEEMHYLFEMEPPVCDLIYVLL